MPAKAFLVRACNCSRVMRNNSGAAPTFAPRALRQGRGGASTLKRSPREPSLVSQTPGAPFLGEFQAHELRRLIARTGLLACGAASPDSPKGMGLRNRTARQSVS